MHRKDKRQWSQCVAKSQMVTKEKFLPENAAVGRDYTVRSSGITSLGNFPNAVGQGLK